MIKLIAAFCMVIDHIGYIFFRDQLFWRLIGRISMPLYAYSLAKGYEYSHNCKNEKTYIKKLIIFSIISQLPYYLMVGRGWNIGLTWLFSLLLLITLDTNKNKGIKLISIISILILAYLFDVDYGIYGVLMPIAMRQKPLFLSMVLLWVIYIIINGSAGLIQIASCISVPIIYMFKSKDSKVSIPRYFYYIFYPAHIVILLMISYAIKGVKS